MATAIADGAGRNSGLTQPALPASCQNPITSTSAIQPEARPARGVKPPPRNLTGRGAPAASSRGVSFAERSSMQNLALGIDRLFTNQRPQFVLQRQQFSTGIERAAFAARHRDRDGFAHAAGA